MKKDVVLVSYALHNDRPLLSGLMVDNGLALLASVLLREGFSPRIFDYNSVSTIEQIAREGKEDFLKRTADELIGYVREHGVTTVGVKLYANGFADSVFLAAAVREACPNVRVFGGGPQVGWFGARVLDYACEKYGSDVFDAVVSGEGDRAIVQMAQGESVERISGAYFRGEGGVIQKNRSLEVALDSSPYPVYSQEIYAGVWEKIQIPVVEDSRNCDWRKCAFCIHPRIGGKFRERSAESVLKEVLHNAAEYGMRTFRLGGPDPTPDFVNGLARALPDGFRFSAFGRADGQGYDVDMLAQKLIGGLFVGFETADEQMLLRLNKTANPGEYVRGAGGIFEEFRAKGLATVCSLIVPGPGETDESMQRTLDFVCAAGPDFVPVLPLCPMPGTPSRKWGEAEGVQYAADFERQLLEYELDLHKPKSEWARPPWALRVNGVFAENPFLVSAEFAGRLRERGFESCSDEVVLMAEAFYGGLSKEQDARRQSVLQFHQYAQSVIRKGDGAAIRAMIDVINKNV